LSTRLDDVMLVVDLDQLERGARAIALALRPGDIRIVELALKPALGRHRLSLVLDANLEAAAGLLAHGAAPSFQAPSSRIICTSMPSRRPRSATRKRSHGNARRIASRMAQPASTRSARSAPMQGLATRLS